MGHTHINTIETPSPCDHNTGQYKDISYSVSTWMLLQPYTNSFYEGDK